MNGKKSYPVPRMYNVASFVAASVPVLWMSYMMAAKIYSESHLIPHDVLLATCFLLLESLAAICCSLTMDSRRVPGRNNYPGTVPIPTVPPDTEPRTEDSGGMEIYEQSVKENAANQEDARQRLKESIHDYLYWQMAPLLGQEDILPLWIEIEDWLDDRHHRPKSRRWQWKEGVDVKCQDICHLIWNIAKRRGMENGYGTNSCASFIVRLFPDLCKGVKDTTIAQNLTANGDKGSIKIDKPDKKDPTAFHYPMSKPVLQVKE